MNDQIAFFTIQTHLLFHHVSVSFIE